MTKKEIAVKKYVVKLSAEERDRLEAMVRAGKNSAQILTRARILLKADVSEAGDGWSDCAISAALNTSINNVARTRQQLVEEGFARWSLRLLEEKVVELNIVDKASDNTIGRTLKKMSSSHTAIGNG